MFLFGFCAPSILSQITVTYHPDTLQRGGGESVAANNAITSQIPKNNCTPLWSHRAIMNKLLSPERESARSNASHTYSSCITKHLIFLLPSILFKTVFIFIRLGQAKSGINRWSHGQHIYAYTVRRVTEARSMSNNSRSGLGSALTKAFWAHSNRYISIHHHMRWLLINFRPAISIVPRQPCDIIYSLSVSALSVSLRNLLLLAEQISPTTTGHARINLFFSVRQCYSMATCDFSFLLLPSTARSFFYSIKLVW